jgi:hypothetical protein
MTKKQTALAEIPAEELQDIFKGLDPVIQEEITKQTMAKMSDDNLNLCKDRFMMERMLSLTMVEYLKKACFKRIQDGDVHGGKAEDATNKYFLKLLEAEERLKEAAKPSVSVKITGQADQDTVRELVIGRSKIPVKVVDAEFKEVK